VRSAPRSPRWSPRCSRADRGRFRAPGRESGRAPSFLDAVVAGLVVGKIPIDNVIHVTHGSGVTDLRSCGKVDPVPSGAPSAHPADLCGDSPNTPRAVIFRRHGGRWPRPVRPSPPTSTPKDPGHVRAHARPPGMRPSKGRSLLKNRISLRLATAAGTAALTVAGATFGFSAFAADTGAAPEQAASAAILPDEADTESFFPDDSQGVPAGQLEQASTEREQALAQSLATASGTLEEEKEEEEEPEPVSIPSGDPRAIAQAMLADYGWGSDQFSCLDSLWQ